MEKSVNSESGPKFLRSQRQGNCKIKTSLGNIVRNFLKIRSKKRDGCDLMVESLLRTHQ